MPSGVGARARAIRAVVATVVVAAGLAVLATPAHAQAAPGGQIIIVKQIEGGGDVTAFFTVLGDPDVLTAQATTVGGQPAIATPPMTDLPFGSYVVREDGTDGPFQLTSIECDDPDADVDLQGQQAIISLTDEAPVVTCTFTNTLAGAAILGQKIVTGDTSSWTRPAQFHITCPELQLDIPIEPPIGPGGPGTYTIGQGFIPPATCTITETDTGSDAPVIVSSFVTNHGSLIAVGGNAVTFTAGVGDDLVLTVNNQFPPIGQGEPTRPRERPEQGSGGTTTTTVAGGTTTTTTATTTAATTTTVPGGATTTSSGGGQAPTSAPTTAPATAPAELPTTGDSAGTLIAAALAVMVFGLALVARTRRLSGD